MTAKDGSVDPDDVTRYGAILHEAAHGGGSCECDAQPLVRKQFDKFAEVLLTQLAADRRLVTDE